MILISWSGTVPSLETLLTQQHTATFWWVTATDKFKGKETIKSFVTEFRQTLGFCCLIHSDWHFMQQALNEIIVPISRSHLPTWLGALSHHYNHDSVRLVPNRQKKLLIGDSLALGKSWYRATGGLPGAGGVGWGFAHNSCHTQHPEGPCLWWAHEIMPALTVSLCQEQHWKLCPGDNR